MVKNGLKVPREYSDEDIFATLARVYNFRGTFAVRYLHGKLVAVITIPLKNKPKKLAEIDERVKKYGGKSIEKGSIILAQELNEQGEKIYKLVGTIILKNPRKVGAVLNPFSAKMVWIITNKDGKINNYKELAKKQKKVVEV